MVFLIYFLATLALFGSCCLLYGACGRGLSSKAWHQQMTRFGIGSLIAMAPLFIAGPVHWSAALWLISAIVLLQMITYPLLYFLTNRRVSPDIDNFMDIAVGEYLWGWLLAPCLIMSAAAPGNVVFAVVLSLVEVALAAVLLFQWGYFLLFGGCFDTVGARVIRETNLNEIIEYTKTGRTLLMPLLYLLLLLAAIAGVIVLNIKAAPIADSMTWWQYSLLGVYFVAVGWLIWNPRDGAVRRTGPVKLMLDELDYARRNKAYHAGRTQRLADLQVRALGHRINAAPRTIIMVIGESASRDYMSVFAPQPEGMDTTPWLSSMAEQGKCVIFPNAYSCAFQTVPALERALTEKNQYNSLEFTDSVSIVDMAQRLGYQVHWYSNQGHLGCFDTPVTLVAETAEVAKWTKQQVGKLQYDGSLLDFFSEIDPGCDNFIVFHLKGSHFNFYNRYPADHAVWGGADETDPIVTYRNSIRYTDSVLKQIYDYAVSHLNLQNMVYFSDHATVPDRRRSPRFDGFGQCRIPLVVIMSDQYRAEHPERAAALDKNQGRWFTNDLAYDLMCGIFDVESNHFDPTQSLAYDSYRFERTDLLTYTGTRHISDDNS